MLGVLLALVLVAELRNGMQLANIAGDTQDIVIGGLLLAAIVLGNLLRATQAGGARTGWLRLRRREVMGRRVKQWKHALSTVRNSRV
jgi:rhamnose transport system permease protein